MDDHTHLWVFELGRDDEATWLCNVCGEELNVSPWEVERESDPRCSLERVELLEAVCRAVSEYRESVDSADRQLCIMAIIAAHDALAAYDRANNIEEEKR